MTNQEIIENGKYQKYIKELEKGYDELLEYLHGNKPEYSIDYNALADFYYFKVDEIAYEDNENFMEQIIFALYSMDITFSIVYKYANHKLNMYIGAHNSKILELYRIFNGRYKVLSIDVEKEISDDKNIGEYYGWNSIFSNKSMIYGGVIRGNLGKENISLNYNSVIDDLISGVQGREFTLAIVATPFAKREIIKLADSWSNLQNRGQLIKSRQVSIRDDFESISFSDISYKVIDYIKIIEGYYEQFLTAINNGLWKVSVKYYATDEEVADTIAGIIVSNTYSKEAPEIVKAIKINNLKYNDEFIEGIRNISMDNSVDMTFPLFSNWYSTKELSVICDMPHKDTFGTPVRRIARFDLSRQEENGLSVGNILYKEKITNNTYYINPNELNRHTLVVGLTGGGKTNTLKHMLMEIYDKEIPFLVIEPAKKEYWELYKLGCDKLKIFSIGSKYNNLYINPFQRAKGVPLQTHIDYVFASFKASFIMYPPMPYILERAIYLIYEDCGWNIEEDYNLFGEVYPTIENLYNIIPEVAVSMGYDEREQRNFIGALQARINTLRIGIKGEVFNVKKTYPIENLLDENVVIELDNIGDDEVKAFIISMILIQVMEYRMQCDDAQLELRHLILIEEAHRLLKNISSGTGEYADPRGNAVEFFCNMLAELRSKGQGFVIADQIPSKLAPDIIKNTNLKIVHRMVAKEEREVMGGSMHMNDEQIEYLSTLKQGVAAVYSEGDYNPKLVKLSYAGQRIIESRKNIQYRGVCDICKDDKELSNVKNQSKMSCICSLCPFDCNGESSAEIFGVVSYNEISLLADVFKSKKTKDKFVEIIALILKNIENKKMGSASNYIFCFLNEFVNLLELTYNEKYAMYKDVLEILEEKDNKS